MVTDNGKALSLSVPHYFPTGISINNEVVNTKWFVSGSGGCRFLSLG